MICESHRFGRIVSAEVSHLPDGELALEGMAEIFEETDTFDSLAGDGRAIEIPREDIPTFNVEYYRTYETADGDRLLESLKELSPASESVPIAKKAFEPISTIVIAAGVFAIGTLATGFLSKLGEEVYEGLKARLAAHFQRTSSPSPRILDFRFTVAHQGDFVEVHVLVENPTTREQLEVLFSSNFAGLDALLLEFDHSKWAIAKFVLQYKNGQLDVLYLLRKDCVPGIPESEQIQN